MWAELGIILASYLLGSIPLIYLLGKMRGVDLRKRGSGNIGAGNLWQMVGPVEGTIGGIGDVAKGAIPVLVVTASGFELYVAALAGLAAIAGQCWPIFLKFNGGRGNSAALGMVVALAPLKLLIALVPLIIGAAIWGIPHLLNRGIPLRKRLSFVRSRSRAVPLGMTISIVLFPLLYWLWPPGGEPLVTLICTAIFALIAIRRMTVGVRHDLSQATDKWSILVNRFLYDRSYRDVTVIEPEDSAPRDEV